MEILMDNQIGSQFDKTYEEVIYGVVAESLKQEGFHGNAEISISIVNNAEMQNINRKFRRIDAATDVLSFPMHENIYLHESEKEKNIVLGDIVISMEKAITQAEDYGHSVEREVGFLTAHGMLHLFGYDHMTVDEEKVMFSKQKDILDNMNLGRLSIERL